MSTKSCYRFNRIIVLIILSCLLVLGCVSDAPVLSEEGTEDIHKVPDIDLVQPVAMEVIGQAGAKLLTALSATMGSAGIKDAIGYCNLNANLLVKDLALEYGVDIKRTSLKLRNPNNEPTKDEELILAYYASQHNQGEVCEGELSKVDGVYKYYHPIYLMDKCTACHGIKGETLNKKAAKKLEELYPNDQALGYEAGDLRGMWVLTFKKSSF